ncbi:SpoIIE family protein phosphatase [Nonomuraea ferruginea]
MEHYQLHAGDRLLFYTDGIVEARSPEGEPFGLERFIDFIVRREADGLLGAGDTAPAHPVDHALPARPSCRTTRPC